MGWIVGVAWLQCQARGDQEGQHPSTHHPPLRALARRVDRVLTALSRPPQQQQAPSTHSHAYEPLLVGWIVGADDRGIKGNGDEEGATR
jgi:hypothetical protein